MPRNELFFVYNIFQYNRLFQLLSCKHLKQKIQLYDTPDLEAKWLQGNKFGDRLYGNVQSLFQTLEI